MEKDCGQAINQEKTGRIGEELVFQKLKKECGNPLELDHVS